MYYNHTSLLYIYAYIRGGRKIFSDDMYKKTSGKKGQINLCSINKNINIYLKRLITSNLISILVQDFLAYKCMMHF